MEGMVEMRSPPALSMPRLGYGLEMIGALGDDCPDFVVPMARAVAKGDVTRGLAIDDTGSAWNKLFYVSITISRLTVFFQQDHRCNL